MPLPPLSPTARAAALHRANLARRERSVLLAALKAGRISLHEVLNDDDPVIARTRVRSLLESLPRVGKVGATRHLTELRIAERRRVRGLGGRQRAQLIARFAPQY